MTTGPTLSLPKEIRLNLVILFLLLLVGAISSPIVSPSAVIAQGEAAYWRFEESAGTTAQDSSGNSNTGAINGAAYTGDAPSLAGTTNDFALFFDATASHLPPVNDHYVSIPAHAGTNLNTFDNGVTLEAFIRPDLLPIPGDPAHDTERVRYIIWADDGAYELRLVTNDATRETFLEGGVNFVGGNASTCSVAASAPFSNSLAGQFSHVALTYADEVLRLYLDGQQVAQASSAGGCGSAVGPVGSRNVVHIGSDETAVCCDHDRDWHGVIDEVRITGRALDPSEFLNAAGTSEIHGTKWDDQNGDGVRDPGEPGLGGWTIFLDRNGDGVLNNPVSGDGTCDANATEPCTHTDANGDYQFTGLAADNYTVGEVLRPGWEQTSPASGGRLFVVQAVPLGVSIDGQLNGQISVAGESDVYTFTLAADSRLHFDSLTNQTTLRWSLEGPPGQVVSNRAFTSSDSFDFGDPALGLPAGDYTLTVDATGDATGAYAFRFLDLASATPITPGTPVSGALDPANESDLYRFDASAGDRFFFDVQTGVSNATWRLVDPYSNILFSRGFSTDEPTLTLSQGGTYVLVIEGRRTATGSASYTFNVQSQGNVPPVPLTGTPLTIGDTINGSIATPGEEDAYLFTRASASRLYFDSFTSQSTLRWSLAGPPGQVVSNRAFTGSDSVDITNPVLFLAAGQYVLTVNGTGDATGPYSFRLLDLASATPLTPGTPVVGTLDPANETDLYRFNASAGEQFFFDSQSFTGATNAYWRLIDPYNNVLFRVTRAIDVDTMTLSQSGVYTLLIEGRYLDTEMGDYTFNVQPVAAPTPGALALAQRVDGSIGVPGESDIYIFTLASASRLYFDSFTNDNNLRWSLDGPSGQVVTNRAFTGSDSVDITNPVLALPAGDYTLTVDATGDATVPYSFRLLELASATPFTPGTPVSGTLDPANETDLYRFTANAGDRFFFDSQAFTGAANAYWRLIDPYNNVLFRVARAIDVSTLTMAQPGVYTLLIEGRYLDTEVGNYTFNVIPQGNVPPVPFTGAPLTLGATTSGSISTPGEEDGYLFTLATDSRLHFDSLTNQTTLRWSLQGPPGQVVSNRAFTSSDSNDFADPVLELPAGDYALSVNGSGDATGSYNFRLLDLASATPITPGAPVNSTLDPANESDLYRFDATAGDRFFFDVQAGVSNATWRLVDPFGNILFSRGFTTDQDTLTLSQGGAYVLTIEGRRNATGLADYSFNVQPVADSGLGANIIEIDPTTGVELNRFPAPVDIGPVADVAFDGVSLFFANGSATLWELDPANGNVLDADDILNSPGFAGLAALNGNVYLNRSDSQVLVFDPAADAVTGALDLVGSQGVRARRGLAAITGPDALLVIDANAALIHEVDPTSGSIIASNAFSSQADDLAVVGTRIYRPSPLPNQLTVFRRNGVSVGAVPLPFQQGLIGLGSDDPAGGGTGVHQIVVGDGEVVGNIDFGNQFANIQEVTLPFELEGQDSVPFHLFSVITEGAIQAEVSWTGASQNLTVLLTGRRRPNLPDPTTPYAQVTGTSPLNLSYQVTQEDLDRGVGWRLAIRDASGTGAAQGTIRLTTPFDANLEPVFQREKIQLRSGDHWPSAPLQQSFLDQLLAPSTQEGLHGLISLAVACDCHQARQLEQLGLVRQSILPRRHAFGFVSKDLDVNHPAITQVLRGLTPQEPEDKIDPHVLLGNYQKFEVTPEGEPTQNYILNTDGTLELAVLFAQDVSPSRAQAILTAEAIAFSDISDSLWRATVAPANLTQLAAYDEVEWIEATPAPQLHTLAVARGVLNVDAVQAARTDISGNLILVGGMPVYDGLTGLGINVGIDESGRTDDTHPDLNIVQHEDPGSGDYGVHATHVAGIVGASGLRSASVDADGDGFLDAPFQWRGVAPRSGIIDSDDLIDTDDLLEAIEDSSLDLANHSHTIGLEGDYDGDNRTVDQEVRGGARADDTLVPRRPKVFAAGNNGVDVPDDDRPQYGDQRGYFSLTNQTKNAILVGNLIQPTQINASSSMGPTHDGRIKPDVVAPGSFIGSTGTAADGSCLYNDDRTNSYGPCSGTSMASPMVAGVLALLLEGWQDTYSTPLGTSVDVSPPLPSTLRALIIQTAVDIVNAAVQGGTTANADVDADSNSANGNQGNGFATATVGPDFTTGWGRVDAQAAVNLMQDFRTVNGVPVPNRIIQDSIVHGRFKEYDFAVDGTINQLQVTLAWDDVESSSQNPATNRMLINDLDLELVAPNGTIFYPWQLGQTILDLDGNVLANNAQPPGTNIQVQIPITPTDDPDDNNDYVPANALTGNGSWVATQGKDHLNNVEQVLVQNPQQGRWKVRVLGFDVNTRSQDFSVVGFPYPDLPDLVASSDNKVGISALNQDITFTWTATNVGPVATGGTFNYQVLLSRDFFLGDDVALVDANQTTLGPLAAGTAVQQTSTIQITQADVDALLGPGSTLEDLLAADVFILVWVDSTDQILEHNETNITFVQLARLVDVALVMDRSASMTGQVPVSNGNRPKIDLLKESANLFLDLIRKDEGDRLSAISFSGTVASDFPLGDLTSANVNTIRAAINAMVPDNGTNISGGLEQGVNELLTGVGGQDRRRVLVFFSDGEWTVGIEPKNPNFLQQFATNDVHMFSVGYGTEGGSDYAGIDIELLQLLSQSGAPGGFSQVTISPQELDKFFVDAVAGAVEAQVIVDPVQDIGPGGIHQVGVPVTRQASEVTFVLTWDNPAVDLNLALRSPTGMQIHVGNFGNLGGRVSHLNKPTHEAFTVKLPLSGGADQHHGGRWQMVVVNPTDFTVRYSTSAIVESTVRVTVAPPQPTSGSHVVPGDPVLLQVDVREMGETPVTDAVVTVTPTVPLVSLGDLLSSAQVDLTGIPTDIGGDALTLQERIVIALQQQFGGNPLPRGEGDSVVLPPGQTGDTYTGNFTQTGTDGVYRFLVRVEGLTADCDEFQRESTPSINVPHVVSPNITDITVTTPTGPSLPGDVTITVTPFGPTGSYIGPGFATAIQVDSSGPVQPSTEMTDQGNGSYSQTYTIRDQGAATLRIAALGTALRTIQLNTGLPAPISVTPAGGQNDTSHTITIAAPPGSNLSGVTGVSLVSGNQEEPLGNVSVDDANDTVQADVPAGIAPGLYQVRFESNQGHGPTSPDTTYRATGLGQDFPPYVNDASSAFGNVLGAATNTEGISQLGLLLRDLRRTPTGPNFTADAKRQALDEVIGLIAQGQGQVTPVDLPDVSSALNQSKIDARFFRISPVATPGGTNITVPLGNLATVKFGQVTNPGNTNLNLLGGPPQVPPERRGNPHVAYDITTTAGFDPDLLVDIEIKYQEGDFPDESNLRIFHNEGGQWVDRTAGLNTGANLIQAQVRGLSEFVIVSGEGPFEPVGVCGDQNDDGQVNIFDAIIDLQIIAGLIDPSADQQVLSDVVRNGTIDIFDVILTLQHIAGLTVITECGPSG